MEIQLQENPIQKSTLQACQLPLMLMLADLSKLLDLARYYPSALQLDPVLF